MIDVKNLADCELELSKTYEKIRISAQDVRHAGKRRNKDHGHFELHLSLAVVTDGVTTGEEWRLHSSSTKRALYSLQGWHFTPPWAG